MKSLLGSFVREPLRCFFFFSSRRRHTRFDCDWSSDVCSSDLGSGGRPVTTSLYACNPPGRRLSGITVMSWKRNGRRCTRGSPAGGAPTSSSTGTPCARASSSSSSSVGRRWPLSSRDSVLTEIPVARDSAASVTSRRRRSSRSRGPTAASTWPRSSSITDSLPERQANLRRRPLAVQGAGGFSHAERSTLVPHHYHATHDQPGHDHGHAQDSHEEVKFTQEFWDDRYSSAGQLWSGKPNAQLVEQA